MENKRAIIILPGIMASHLYDRKNNNLLWPRFNFGLGMRSLMETENMHDFLSLDDENGAYRWIDQIRLRKDGTSNYDGVFTKLINDPTYDEVVTRYAANDELIHVYHRLEIDFGDRYDIRLFEYDWRYDVRLSARALERYIDMHGYEEVILVGHSLGGILATYYLQRNNRNRDKVRKLVTLGTPYLGAETILAVLEDPKRLVMLDDEAVNLVREYIGNEKYAILSSRLREMVHSIRSLYEVIPQRNTFDIRCPIHTRYGDDYEAYKMLIKGKAWANSYILDEIESTRDIAYIEGEHVTSLVDSTYIAGRGKSTTSKVVFDSDDNMIDTPVYIEGDGIVPLYSAICGLDISDDRVVVIDDCTHAQLLSCKECLDSISDAISKVVNKK